jgi:SAM-dependent methyltransferase
MTFRQLTDGITIAGSGALLFVVQPMMAKTLLPRFGGSAGVWVACMMFFQIALLLGYLYAYCMTRYLAPVLRTAVHVCLLCGSLLLLPLRPHLESAGGNPTASILLTLAASVGLPFFLLSSTSPLLQYWHAGPMPYALFAVSNAACLLALLAYPVAIEPALAATAQMAGWSIGYAAIAVLLMAAAVRSRAWTFAEKPYAPESDDAADRSVLWILLAACPSALWLAAANHLSQEVAAIPFLWVLPMSAYLLTLVIAFAADGWYRPAIFRWLLPAAWIAIGSRTGLGSGGAGLRTDIALTLVGLFVVCLFCHGELARSRPALRQRLPFFYFIVATGGAVGGIFVGVAAPALFSGYLEFPIAVAGSVMLALPLVYGVTSRARLIRLGLLAAVAFVIALRLQPGGAPVAKGRNFYGALEIRDSGAVRTLYNGRTIHGAQFLAPERRRTPIAYYGPQSGIARVFDATRGPRRVGIIGLGTGTLAAYGARGDRFRFYEINPAVVEAASRHFYFLADSAAETDVLTGDGRLLMEREPLHSFDLIVLDAFSDDAIPVHLLTREAFQSYFERLRGGGALAVHVTNRYLDLEPVLEALARACQKDVVRFHNLADPELGTLDATWVAIADPATIASLGRYGGTASSKTGALWTDEYSNLFQIWR